MQSKNWLAYKIIVFYCFLASARACMTFGENPYLDFALAILALIILPGKFFEHTLKRTVGAFFLVVAAMYTMHGSWLVSAYIAQFATVFIPAQLIFLKKEYQIDLFVSLSKWFAILLAASGIWWLLWLIGVPLPHQSSGKLDWENGQYGYMVQNYYLFRHSVDLNPYLTPPQVLRFNGFFLEPGHMGTITSIFLFANKFDLKKWQNIIFLFIIAVSLSAAAYIITAIGYCMYRYARDRFKVMLPLLAIMFGILIASLYNGGDNIINNTVFAKFTRENGAVEGRFSAGTLALWDQVVANGQLLFGVGAGADIHQSAGYKVFLIMNGLFGAALVVVSYWIIQLINRSKFGLYLFILFIISFIQRTYCFWDAFLDPYILGCAYLSTTESFNKTTIRI